MIIIANYGVGNLASVQNMLKRCGLESQVSNDPNVVGQALKIILPGVGAFDTAMKKINESGLDTAIKRAARNGSSILGICLGAQLLMENSEEGTLSGLSLIRGTCKKFDIDRLAPLRVPHMGWSEVTFVSSHTLSVFESQPRFYFSHSYYIQCASSNNILATSIYGREFTCGVADDNVMGVQFHPEKSHAFGVKFFQNFNRL